MSIGRISSPTTPIPVGTVASPAWASTVEDDINGLLDGTGPTLKSLQIDGIGGAAASSAAQLSVRQATPADTPLALFSDSAGNVRWLVDHNGYPLGRRSEFRQEWIRSDLSFGMFSNPDAVTSGGNSSYPANIAQRNGGTSASTGYNINTPILTTLAFTGMSIVVEMDVAFSTLSATNTALFAGLTDSVNPASATNLIGFLRSAGGTNWFATLTGATPVDLGLAPITSSTPPQRLRLEVHGSASPYGSGGNGKVRCWVNDVLKAEVSGPIPAVTVSILIGAGTTGSVPSGATNTLSGSILAVWNRALSIPAL